MIDQILGRPVRVPLNTHREKSTAYNSIHQSSSWKRTQILLVALFWLWNVRSTNRNGPRLLRRYGQPLAKLTPWQLCVGTLVSAYIMRNLTHLLNLAGQPVSRDNDGS